MPRRGKRWQEDMDGFDFKAALSLREACEKLKSFGTAKFDQTVDIAMHLGVDPKHADQLVRGAISLPHSSGKMKRVICFCAEDQVEAAKAAGAVEAGGQELAKRVADGWLDFDVVVAHPATMKFVGVLGKQLGPKGLMPSPKAGTVTADIETAIREYAAGKVEFRTDKAGNVHAPVGKLSFSIDQLEENIQIFLALIEKLRPSTVKGQYVKKVSLSGTMTPGVRVACS